MAVVVVAAFVADDSFNGIVGAYVVVAVTVCVTPPAPISSDDVALIISKFEGDLNKYCTFRTYYMISEANNSGLVSQVLRKYRET